MCVLLDGWKEQPPHWTLIARSDDGSFSVLDPIDDHPITLSEIQTHCRISCFAIPGEHHAIAIESIASGVLAVVLFFIALRRKTIA